MPAPKFPFTDELAQEICQRIAEGEPLREICREPGKPSWKTVYRWIEANRDFIDAEGNPAKFGDSMEAARKLGARAIAEECLEIADDATNDWMEKRDKDGAAIGWELNKDHVQRSKLRIETRLKLLAKWHPKEYGERTTLAGDPDAPLGTGVMVVPAPVSEEAWAAGLAAQQRQLTEREDAASRQGGGAT